MNNDIEIMNNTILKALETKHLTPELIMRWNKIGYNHSKKIYDFLINGYDVCQEEIDKLNNIIDDALGIANERINYYNHKQIEAEDWSEIFNVLVKRDNHELKGSEFNE